MNVIFSLIFIKKIFFFKKKKLKIRLYLKLKIKENTKIE